MDDALARYEEFIAKVKAKPKTVLVVGDSITDRYVDCTMAKIAPEGGAPVLNVTDRRDVDGGAANVAEQLRQWNVNTICRFQHAGIHVKTRYVADGRLWMVASEDSRFVRPAWDGNSGKCTDCLTRVDCIVVADYGKGCITPEVARALVYFANLRNIPIIVDPTASPAEDADHRWAKATVVKMNREQWQRRRSPHKGMWLEERKIDNLVITNGPRTPDVHGYYGSRQDDCQRPVVDTAGAGDHFSAVLAVGIMHGLGVGEAAMFAHVASKLRVAYRRPRPILPAEVRGMFDQPLGKILDVEDVATLLKTELTKHVVFTNGCFDPFTAGHQTLLDYAKRQGDVLVVGVNSDQSTANLKSGRPIMPAEQRARVLAANSSVDFVIVFDEPTPEAVMRKLGPIACLVKGDEYAGCQRGAIPGSDIAGRVAFAPAKFKEHASDFIAKVRSIN